MRTTAEQIAHRLDQAYDRSFYEGMYEQMHRTFGEIWHASSTPSGIAGLKLPDWPDIRSNFQEVGTSQRILNTQFITLSRIMRSMPEPEFPDLDRYTAEVRKQFWQARAKGTGYADGEWLSQLASAFMDGDGLGTGVVQVGLKADPVSGYKKTHIKHVPVMQTLWDRNERSILKARWICTLNYIAVDVAEAMYGKKALKDCLHTMRDNNTASPIECYRIIEYWDMGFGKGDPTYAIIPHDLDREPLKIEDNPFGCLPFAFYEHLLTPGMRRPIGRIALLLAGQQALNDGERSMRAEAKRPGFDIVDESVLDPEDLKAVNSGEPAVVAKTLRPLQGGEEPYKRIPAGEMGESLLKYMEYAERDFTRVSGVNDFDMGIQSTAQRTLGENQLLDARSKVQSNWSVLQATLLFQRTIEKVQMVAKVGDTDPVTLNVFGNQIPINDPDQPASSIANFLQQDSDIVVSEQSLMKGDADQERMQKTMILDKLAPLVQAGAIPVQWFTDEYLEALGYDPKEVAQAAAAQQQASSGQQQGKPPIENINYKDAPPSIQAQMEQQAGLQPASVQERAIKALAPEVVKGIMKPAPKPPVKPAAKKPTSASTKK